MTSADFLTLPNFLTPFKDGVENYMDAPEIVGKIVIAVASKIFKGADIAANLSPCERGVYRQWLKVAEDGIEKAIRERRKMKNAAAARWGAQAGSGTHAAQAANPSGGKPSAPVPANPPAPVRRITPNPSPSGGERRGGARAIGDCLGNLGSFLGTGGGMEDMINADPVKAALQITGETGDKRAENTLKKYLREKGESPFRETLFAFNSELKNGEEPRNRGQALNARLRELPDISKGART